MDGIFAAMVGGFLGGILGVIGTIVTSYYGPRKIEEWKDKRQAEKWDNPRKDLLKRLLNDRNHKMRSIETLCRVSGTSPDECRRLLIEIRARGVQLEGKKEGWALISRKPLSEIPADMEDFESKD